MEVPRRIISISNLTSHSLTNFTIFAQTAITTHPIRRKFDDQALDDDCNYYVRDAHRNILTLTVTGVKPTEE